MNHFRALCVECGGSPKSPAARRCEDCDGALTFEYRYDDVRWDERFSESMWRYWRLLPVADPQLAATLGEGRTPLLRTRAFPNHHVWWKDETRNPTGSHKDRSLAVAIAQARSIAARCSVAVSAGSTGISNAAYAARAGLRSIILMSRGTPSWRAYPVFALGSTLIEIDADIDSIIAATDAAARKRPIYVSSTTRMSNPHQSEGTKTIAYEIVEHLGHTPDWLIVPVGGGGSIAGVWRGFNDLQRLGRISRLPRLVGVVPAAYDALAVAFKRGITSRADFMALPYTSEPTTIVTKLAHAHPPDGMEALAAVRESQGLFVAVTDAQAMDGSARIGRVDGLFVEPSSGVVAGAIDELVATGAVTKTEHIVALLCGSGFRESIVAMERRPIRLRSTDIEHLEEILASEIQP
ncbi:MAG: threonine synthase [Dongiaceae bacterium]